MTTYDYTVLLKWRHTSRPGWNFTYKTISKKGIPNPYAKETKLEIARELKSKLASEQYVDTVSRVDTRNVLVTMRRKANMKKLKMKQTFLNYTNIDGSDKNQGTCVIDKLEQYKPREYLTKYFDNYESGICIEQIKKFCVEHDISMYACDLHFNKLLKHKSKSSNLPAFIFVIANGHIYEVTNKKQRSRICRGSNIQKPSTKGQEAPELKELSKELSEPFNKSDFNLDDINPDFEKIPSGNWYLPGDLYNLERLFFYIVKVDKLIPPCRYINDTMVMVNWPRKFTTIYYNSNLTEVKQLIDELQIPFTNQSLGQLVKSITGDFKESWSTYTNETLSIVKNLQAKPLVKDLEKTYEGKLIAVDIKRCYLSILEKYELPIINITNEVEKYTNQELTDCYCYVNTTDNTLYYGPGWYPCYYVKAFPQPVTHILRYQITTLDFTSADKFKNNKLIINTSIGLLGKKESKITQPVFTTSPEEAGYYCWLSNKPCTIMENSDITLYKVIAKQKRTSTLGGRLMYCFIVQMGRLACYELLQTMKQLKGFTPIRIRTDCVIGTIPKKNQSYSKLHLRDKQPGDYRIVDYQITELHPEEETYQLFDYHHSRKISATHNLDEKWDPEICPKMLFHKYDSFICIAPAGSGKTMLLNKMYKEATKAVVLAYTGVACSMLHDSNAQTLHSFFKISSDEPFIVNPDMLRYLAEKTKVVFVDEISMLGIAHFTALLQLKQLNPSIKFYLFGDYRQLPPVDDIQIGLFSAAMMDLTNTILHLNYNFRNGEFAKQLASGTFDITTCRKWTKYDMCNITHTNKLANKINTIIAKTQPKLGELGSYIRFRKRQGDIPKNFLAVVEQLTPEVKLRQLYGNDRVFTITPEAFNSMKEHLYLAYAFTNYCAQSLTIPINYTIWEWEHPFFNANAKYTALSRCKKPEQICIRLAALQQ